MRKILLIIIVAFSLQLSAQSVKEIKADSFNVEPIESAQLQGREATPEEKEYARQMAQARKEQKQINSNLPLTDNNGQTITNTNFYAPAFYGYGMWNLHSGLNINLGASAFYNFGKGYGHGGGFSQDVSLMYVTNLTPKLTLAVGGYLNHLTYKGDNYFTGGVNALLGYRFNEHWSAYVFAQKAINSHNVGNLYGYSPYWGGYAGYGFMPYGYGFAGMGMGYGFMDTRFMDRIGGGVTYQWGSNYQNSISVSVEYDHLPSHRDTFYDVNRYSYPARN